MGMSTPFSRFIIGLPSILAAGALVACGSDANSLKPAAASSASMQYVGNSPCSSRNRPSEHVPQGLQNEDPAWVELYNPAVTAVNLAGLSLTDARSTPRAWMFRKRHRRAHAYKLVFLSSEIFLTRLRHRFQVSSARESGAGRTARTPPSQARASPSPSPSPRNTKRSRDRSRVSAQMHLGPRRGPRLESFEGLFRRHGEQQQNRRDGYFQYKRTPPHGLRHRRGETQRAALPRAIWMTGSAGAKQSGTGDSATTYSIAIPTGTKFPGPREYIRRPFLLRRNELIQLKSNPSSRGTAGCKPHASFEPSKRRLSSTLRTRTETFSIQ